MKTMSALSFDQPSGVEPAGDLGEPVVDAAEIRHQRAANHDVVEVRDHEVGVVDVHVEADGGEEETGQAADEEQADEPEGIEHRRVVPRSIPCRASLSN